MQKLSRSLIALGGLAVLAACGDDVSVTAPPPATISAVNVVPAAVTIRIGEKVILTASVQVTQGSGSPATTVTWSTANAAIATVSATGEVTGVAAGTTTIRATSTVDAGKVGAAAVTVAGAGIQSVTVAPASAILAPGQTLQAAANVTASPGATRTVTWSSSATAVATVKATGTITAVAPGTATITATSTADPTVAGSMALTVRAPVPATISIKSVTTGGTFFPVDITNVGGQIDVTLNVDPGDQTIQRVEILLDNAVVYSQAFSAEQSTEMSLAAVAEAIAEVVGSINTADFDRTTGVAKYLNGARQLSARAIVAGGTQVATPSLTLQFNNLNRFIETLTLGGTRATATSSTGLVYERGTLTVSVLPVIFESGVTMASGTITFGSGCDTYSGTGRSRSLTAPAAGSGAWTAAFSQAKNSSGTDYTGNVYNYEYGCGGNGDNATLVAASSAGSTLLWAPDNSSPASSVGVPFSSAANPAPRLRLDNRAPGSPTFEANPGIRQNSWINGGVQLTGRFTSTNLEGWMNNGASDGGVGGYVRMLRTGAGPTVDAAIGTAGSTTPALPAPSAANTSYCAVASAADLLGNESALPAAGTNCSGPYVANQTATGANHMVFGVDIAAPTIAFPAQPTGLDVNQRINTATVGEEFVVTVVDTGAVGNSGMLSGSAVVGTVQLRNATATGAATCVIGSYSSSTGVCSPVSVNAAPAFPLVSTTTIAANVTTGYFTYSAVAQDAAGNSSGSVSRVIAHDDAVNPPALTQALFNVPLSGSTATFNANASDNFDLWNVTYTLRYGGGFAFIGYPAVTLNGFNVAPLVNSNVPAGITINGFMRQLQAVTGNNPLAVSAQQKPDQLAGIARDQANNPSATALTAISAASVTTGVSYTAAAAPQLTRSWVITPLASTPTLVSTGNTTPATNPLSVTFTAVACGPTATYASPFTRVDFYAVVAGVLRQIGTASFSGTNDDGSAFGRCHSYTFTWTPGTAYGTAAQVIFAIGVSVDGDGLVTLANTQVTTTDP